MPTADGLVRDMVVQGTRVFIGGNFVQVNGTDQRRFAGLDVSSGASACSTCYHPTYPILDIDAGPNRIYLAGGGGGGKAVALTTSTGAKLWEKKTDGNVQAVSTLNGVPYFGGHFFKYTSIPVNQLVQDRPGHRGPRPVVAPERDGRVPRRVRGARLQRQPVRGR